MDLAASQRAKGSGAKGSDEGLTLKMSANLIFTVLNISKSTLRWYSVHSTLYRYAAADQN